MVQEFRGDMGEVCLAAIRISSVRGYSTRKAVLNAMHILEEKWR